MMILQDEWRAIIIKGRLFSFVKMLALAVILIGLYRVYDIRYNKGDEAGLKSDTEYSEGAVTTYDFAMGTSVVVNLYDEGADSGCSEDILQSISELDSGLISWRNSGSALYGLNNNYETDKPYATDEELYDVLSASLSVCRDSEGALDITIRPLAEVWNIEGADSGSFRVPDASDIEDALKCVGYEKVTLSDGRVTLSDNGMILDLGAVGKGYALDKARACLEKSKPHGAVISVGGSVLVYGSKNDDADWHIGIRDPKGDADDMIGYLTIPAEADICISTSGDYEKYFDIDGVRYHHILDRNTGYPADAGLSSVTVVCENGLISDALSTACFVLGYEDSLPLLDKYEAEAIFIDKDNNITVTDGLTDSFSRN